MRLVLGLTLALIYGFAQAGQAHSAKAKLSKVPAALGVSAGDLVTVHLIAETLNGKELANTHKRGLPMSFEVGEGQVCKALDKLVMKATEGQSISVIAGPDDLYGQSGVLPIVLPGAKLKLTVEIVHIIRG